MGELFYRRICKAADDAVASFDAPLAGRTMTVWVRSGGTSCRGGRKDAIYGGSRKILHSGRHKSCNCAESCGLFGYNIK